MGPELLDDNQRLHVYELHNYFCYGRRTTSKIYIYYKRPTKAGNSLAIFLLSRPYLQCRTWLEKNVDIYLCLL
jgi:hypothetical protein